MLRLILLAQEKCGIVHQNVDNIYVEDEIYSRVDVSCHLQNRKSNRELGRSEITRISDYEPGA